MDIKQLRQTTGLTQKEFCNRYLIPLKTLQNWESDDNLPSARKYPQYLLFLLERAIKEDFPVARRLIESNIDERHLTTIEHAKRKIFKSPLSKYVKDVFLYGSTARGESKSSSDVDLLLILDERIKNHKNYNDWISYLKDNISTDDFTIPEADLHVVFGENWKEDNHAYFYNIKKDGFSIWN